MVDMRQPSAAQAAAVPSASLPQQSLHSRGGCSRTSKCFSAGTK